MSNRIIEEQLKVYQPNFIKYGDCPKGTRQNNKETQHLRFQMLTAHLLDRQTHNTIEDIGCGICDLYVYLKEQELNFTYSGTEIVDEMIELARAKYPELTLRNRNILTDTVEDKYDFVVLSGTLNMPGQVDQEEWKAFCFALIKKMYERCNKGIAFNFLTSHRDFSDPTLFYLDPAEVVNHCLANLSRFVELKHSYPLYEGTVSVYREEYVAGRFQNSAFDKYFQKKK